MKDLVITKKEYEELVEAKKRLDTVLKSLPDASNKISFFDKAFGILKGSFGKKTSAAYVMMLRKAWRE